MDKRARAVSPIPLCDPHFHLWDLRARPNPNLGKVDGHPLPSYLASDYLRDVATIPSDLRLMSSVHVETIVGQAPGGAQLDSVSETEWVCGQMSPSEVDRPFFIVAFLHLARSATERERELEAHMAAAAGRLRGVRMILNHHDHNPELTWPQVAHGAFLGDRSFRDGLGLLQRHGFSFDLSCNPHQVGAAVRLLRDFPDLPVVVNHLGFLHEGEDKAHESLWREGIHALAGLPSVSMKLSMLWFGCAAYNLDEKKEQRVRARVLEVIDVFGCDRCMFASNYPVDKFNGISLAQLYEMYLSWTDGFSDTERSALFHDTAVRSYQLS